jgi:hypothetical protein
VLTITIQGDELWDDEAEKFTYTDSTVLQFEHSLVSLSKWEAEFHKLFLVPDKKTEDEMFGYVRAMLVTPDVPLKVLESMSVEQVKQIDDYINDPMTGTIVSNLPQNKSRSSERISSELIYFWMSQYQIPIECENWHLNRLFTLIKIHHAKTQKPQKMSKNARAQQMAELNAQRKAQMGTKG